MRTDVDAGDWSQGGRADIVRESAVEADSGREILGRTPRDLNPRQYCTWLFSWTLYYQLSYSRPLMPALA